MSRAPPTLLVRGSMERHPAEVPVEFITSWLRRRMPEFGRSQGLENRVLIVRSETGSGKSTVLPVAIFRLLRSKDTPAGQKYRGPGVICTQPRVLTAIALVSDVAVSHSPWNSDMVAGVTLGFQTGPVSARPAAGLLYATAGVLAAQLRQQSDAEIMGRYRFILVDEAHERSTDSDLTLMLLRAFYARNAGSERLPFLLLLSATFEPARYAEYFGIGLANVVEVRGRQHRIDTHWPAQGTNDYPAAAAEKALAIHEGHPGDPPERADVLIFTPGAAEAGEIAQALRKANLRYAPPQGAPPPGAPGPMAVLVINREVVVSQTGDYPLVFAKPAELPPINGRRPARRVIVSTVVAETGLTVDTLRYVIDCGWSRTREAYPPWGVEGIITRPAPRTRIEQRRGRVGRLFPGEFHPLYTENVHAALDGEQLPDIVTTGVGAIFLTLVREQHRQKLGAGAPPEFRVEDMTLLDPPPPEAYLAAAAAATALGFLSARAPLPERWPPAFLAAEGAEPLDAPEPEGARGYGLTRLGHVAALFTRTPMEGVRVLLAGYAWGAAASDLATFVALFGVSAADLLTLEERTSPGALPPGARALRAALPPFLVRRAGAGGAGAGALPPSESEAFYFRARLLLADDFAEGLLIFDAFARHLDAAQGDPAAVAGWCAEVGLNFEALLGVVRRRETVVEEMVVAGLDPFRASERRLAALPAEAFTDGLARLKHCLYEGLRATVLRYDPGHPEGAGYATLQGLRVRAPDLLSDAMASRLRALRVTGAAPPRPLWILTDQVRLMPAPQLDEDRRRPLLYVALTNRVSVLDGFVAVDPELGTPRAFPAARAGRPAGGELCGGL